MPERGRLYGVVTADLIGSSLLGGTQRGRVLTLVRTLGRTTGGALSAPTIFRGDSFQSLTRRPEESLRAALIVRANLISEFSGRQMDARVAIGIGTIDSLPRGKTGEGDGQAFRYSGRLLDRLKRQKANLSVKTPWEEIDAELGVELRLLDELVRRWTPRQAKVALFSLKDLEQKKIAKALEKTQSTVSITGRRAGVPAVRAAVHRFREVILAKANDMA